MASAKDAVELAAYQLLTAGAPIGAAVFQDVPQDTAPPVIIVGDMESSGIGGKDDPDRVVSLEVVTVTSGDERKPCLDLQEKIETRLDGAKVAIVGWELTFRFVDDNAALTPDATGYVGLQKFEIMALRP
jgi:hypothetical protein